MLIIYIIRCVVALMAVRFYEYRDYKRNSNYTYNLCDLLNGINSCNNFMDWCYCSYSICISRYSDV